MIQRKGIADTRIHHQRGIVDEIVCGHDVQLFKSRAEPGGKRIPARPGVVHAGTDQRKIHKVARLDVFLRRERRILPHDHAPQVFRRKRDGVVFGNVDGVNEHAEIQNSFVEPLHDVRCVSAEDVTAHFRVFLPHGVNDVGNEPHGVAFASADVDFSAHAFAHDAEIGFSFVDHFHDFFRAPPQEHAFRSEGDVPVAPYEELLSELILQILKLSGESRLCDMKKICGADNRPFARDREEIAQNPYFHLQIPPSCFHLQYTVLAVCSKTLLTM